jgi:2-amino-1-hydroxyethylphosphonate dioxygenase (glycine-forming)
MTKTEAQKAADAIITMYQKHGGAEYAGEAVTQLEHAVQSMQLAKEQGCDEEMMLAAFLHDIGHICVSGYSVNTMAGYGVMNHEKIGAAWLRNRKFSQRLVQLVQAHVTAKRYLAFKEEGYYTKLSDASKQTLFFQGGRMAAEEAVDFESDPLCSEMIAMRRIDEAAKVTGLPPVSLEPLRQMIVRHLTQTIDHGEIYEAMRKNSPAV